MMFYNKTKRKFSICVCFSKPDIPNPDITNKMEIKQISKKV